MNREEQDARTDALAVLARDGDESAFELLCRDLRDDVWRYTHALLGDREQAFDATQDTFLRLVRSVSRWRGDAPIRVYTLVLARRAVADLLRGEVRRRQLIAGTPPPERAVAAHTGTIEVRQLVDRLDPDQRQAFVLTQVVGLRYDEAATVAGVRVGTIRSRVSRARAALMQAIDDAERTNDG